MFADGSGSGSNVAVMPQGFGLPSENFWR
jgi:hypothetical protein